MVMPSDFRFDCCSSMPSAHREIMAKAIPALTGLIQLAKAAAEAIKMARIKAPSNFLRLRCGRLSNSNS